MKNAWTLAVYAVIVAGIYISILWFTSKFFEHVSRRNIGTPTKK